MISTQAQARDLHVNGAVRGQAKSGNADHGIWSVKQCNQIANVSKRTIKAAISGVPIAEVINKFTEFVGEAAGGIQFKR